MAVLVVSPDPAGACGDEVHACKDIFERCIGVNGRPGLGAVAGDKELLTGPEETIGGGDKVDRAGAGHETDEFPGLAAIVCGIKAGAHEYHP